MGVDLLDLSFRIERRFGVKISESPLAKEIYDRRDIQVRDFVAWVEAIVREQNPQFEECIPELVYQDICTCLAVDIEDVKPDAWLVKDLGMH